MRKFHVVVNGASYEVEVEEVAGSAAPSAPSVAAEEAPTPKVAPASPSSAPSAPPPAPTSLGEGEIVVAPLPGTVLDIKVRIKDKVQVGQVLLVLEAMKMENEIVSPTAGVVAEIRVTKGSAVTTGEALVRIV